MWLPATDAQFDRHVSNIVLNEPRERSHLIERCGSRSREGGHFLLDLDGSIAPSRSQTSIPISHSPPCAEPIRGRTAAREEGHNHLSHDPLQRRHLILFPDRLEITHGPLPASVSGLRWLGLRIVEP